MSDRSESPFIIDTQVTESLEATEAAIFKESADGNGDDTTDLVDLSVLLSSYGKDSINTDVDLNGDGQINQIDLYLIRQILLKNEIIQ